MNRIFASLAFIVISFQPVFAQNMKEIIKLSRQATVEISSGNSKGTGFFIGPRHIATCFHVVGSLVVDNGQIKVSIPKDIKVKLMTGETLDATVASIPTEKEPEPVNFDFAILEVKAPIAKVTPLKLYPDFKTIEVGDDVVFSGYPLATPAMVTHKGMISGSDSSSHILCVQGPINKGNSGGALCDSTGRVIGIVSMREGGISQGLQQLNQYIDETSKHGSVAIMGVDPLQATRAISTTLDQYISTGIGYARSTSFLDSYLQKHSDFLK